MELHCLSCKKTMRPSRSHPDGRWACTACGTRAATVAHLRSQVGREYAHRFEALHVASASSRQRPCPGCAQKMELAIQLDDKIEVDVCRACKLVWLDRGELEALTQGAQALQWKQAVGSDVAADIDDWTGDRVDDSEPEARDWQYFAGLIGLPVLETKQKRRTQPYLTWTVAALLVVVFLMTEALGFARFEPLAFVPASLRHGVTPGLVTSFLLHAGWWHLLSNLYFLLVFGEEVECVVGPVSFLALLAVGTVAGNLATYVAGQAPTALHVGASGGISAALAFFACKFPHATLYVRTYRQGFVRMWSLIERFPAALGFLGYLVLQLLGAFVLTDPDHAQIGYVAHLGGAAAGLLWYKLPRTA